MCLCVSVYVCVCCECMWDVCVCACECVYVCVNKVQCTIHILVRLVVTKTEKLTCHHEKLRFHLVPIDFEGYIVICNILFRKKGNGFR